jgi:hypothetical protein
LSSIGTVLDEAEMISVPLRYLQVIFELLTSWPIVDFQSAYELPCGEAINAQPGMAILIKNHVKGARNYIAVQE